MDQQISGGCACGAVRYQAGAAIVMMNCHCRDCQRATGSAFAPTLVVPRQTLQLAGELRYHEVRGGSGKAVRRGFCPKCGSPVAGEADAAPGVTLLYAATLDDPSIYEPSMELFTASAQAWASMSAGTSKLPQGLAQR